MNGSEVRMELVALVTESPDVVLQVPVLVDLGRLLPEHLGVVLLVLDAHVVAHVGLHLCLAHALLGKNLRVLILGPGKDDLCVGCCVQETLFVNLFGLLIFHVRFVFVIYCPCLKIIRVEREVLLIRFSFVHQVL